MNLSQIMTLHARQRPHELAIQGADREGCERALDYASLEAELAAMAGGLGAIGVRPGDVVAVGLGEIVSHAVALYAAARLGAIVLPLDHRWTSAELARALSAFPVRAALLEPENLAALGAERDAWPALRGRWVYAGAAPSGGLQSAVPLADLIDGPPMEAADRAPGGGGWDDAPLFIALTTGTTGTPKGAVLTHGQMRMRLVSQWAHLDFGLEDRYLSATPLYHGAGRSFVMSHLYLGAKVFLCPPPFDARRVLTDIQRQRITTLFLVPTLLQRLLEVPDLDAFDRSSLRVVVSSGAALTAELRAAVQAHFSPRLFDYYGSTDGGGISLLRPGEQATHADSVGRAMLHTEVRITDAAGRALPPGQEGEVCFRGPGVCTGYYGNAQATAEAFRDGWFHPGDLGWLDEEGYLHISGRMKDIIIRGGENLHPTEIEAALTAHPAVREAAVVGAPDAELGEVPVAFVVLRSQAEEADLRAFVGERLARHKVPARIVVLEKLPRNVGGKVLRDDLGKHVRELGLG